MDSRTFCKIQEISLRGEDIVTSHAFCDRIHELACYTEDKYRIGTFLGVLSIYLTDLSKTVGQRRNIFFLLFKLFRSLQEFE